MFVLVKATARQDVFGNAIIDCVTSIPEDQTPEEHLKMLYTEWVEIHGRPVRMFMDSQNLVMADEEEDEFVHYSVMNVQKPRTTRP